MKSASYSNPKIGLNPRAVLYHFCLCLIFPFGLTLAQPTVSWQVTRGDVWGWNQTGSCRLQADKLIVTVHHTHLDVEEEAIISTEGEVDRGDPATLEIIGEFTFAPGAALRSLLLWNGNQILKAKLKDRAAADSAYEAVVDRERPQMVARDPALVEYLGGNRYSYKIYPVAINRSRKIRILYSIPLQSTEQSHGFELKTAFTLGAEGYPSQVPIEFRKGEPSVGKYSLKYEEKVRPVDFGGTYMLPYSAFRPLEYYSYQTWTWLYAEKKILIVPLDSSAKAYTTRIDSGNGTGNYAAIFSSVPRAFLSVLEADGVLSGYSVDAVVKAGSKSYITNLPQGGCLGVFIKSEAPWDGNIQWQAYNDQGEILGRYTETLLSDTVSRSLSRLPLLWGAQYSLKEGLGNLGALFGFVDARMSLLALETDALSDAKAGQYAEEGVPALLPKEIVLDPSKMPLAPRNNAVIEFTPVGPVPADKSRAMDVRVLPNGLVSLLIDGVIQGSVDVALVGLDGRVLRTWNRLRLSGGAVQFGLPQGIKGIFILRVTLGKNQFQKQILIG